MTTEPTASNPHSPPIPEISWFSSNYVPAEDRLRLACSMKAGNGEVMWLTRRLANNLVSKLVEWLDKETVNDSRIADIQHRMAQQSATSKKPKKPEGTLPSDPGWLVQAVQFNSPANILVLTFKGETRSALIRFSAEHLRRWLKVLHAQYGRSDWATDIWPDWISQEEGEPTSAPSGMLH